MGLGWPSPKVATQGNTARGLGRPGLKHLQSHDYRISVDNISNTTVVIRHINTGWNDLSLGPNDRRGDQVQVNALFHESKRCKSMKDLPVDVILVKGNQLSRPVLRPAPTLTLEVTTGFVATTWLTVRGGVQSFAKIRYL